MTPKSLECKIAEGLGKIKDSYNNINSVYAESPLSESKVSEPKIAEGLDKIKASYNDIKSVYAQDANVSP